MTDFIEIYDNALPREVCATLIARFNASNRISRGVTGHGVEVDKKDSHDIDISAYPEWRDAVQLFADNVMFHLHHYMRKYAAILTGAVSAQIPHPVTGKLTVVTPENFEECGMPFLTDLIRHEYRCGRINMQKYQAGVGGYHHWHSETYPQDETCDALHRVLLFQYYLNDVAEGGTTEFLYQQRHVAPLAGRLVIAPAGFTHTHKGHVPSSGDKYVATSWILFRRAEEMYGRAQ